MDKKKSVVAHFKNSEKYLSDNYNITYRSEIVKSLLGNRAFNTIVDIACGNAQISKQYLSDNNKLVLNDISMDMLTKAKKNIPKNLLPNVTFIQGDFEKESLLRGEFDLVICTGLLAHVDDYLRTINRLTRLVGQGGFLIVQNTNASHIYTLFNRLYRLILRIFSKEKYQYNRISNQLVNKLINNNGFQLVNKFNYISSFMFLSRYISGKRKYSFNRLLFGLPDRSHFQKFGNETIFCFKKI